MASCTNDKTVSVLAEAELLSDSLPSLALSKLQKITNLAKLSDNQKATCKLLLAKSLLNSGEQLPSDSILEYPISFYERHNDSLKLSETYFYKGLFNYYKSKHTIAIEYFTRAIEASPQNGFNKQKAKYCRLIGYSYLYLDDTDSAVNAQQKAHHYAKSANDRRELLINTLSLAEACRYAGKTEEALENYKSVLSSAKKEDIDLKIQTLNRLSFFYESLGDLKEALRYKKEEQNLQNSRTEVPTRNLNLATLYFKQNELDSAYHYAKIAMSGNDSYVASIAYSLMHKINEKQGRFVESLSNLKNELRLKELFYSGVTSNKMQQKYQEEKFKNENNELKIKQQQQNIFLIITIFITFLIVVVFAFVWRENERKNEKAKLKNEELLLKNENLLLRQKQEISALREKESMLRESLFKRISVFNKVPSLSVEDADSEKHNKIRLNESDWAELISGVSEVYPNFIDKLREKAPSLTEEDIRFCCLLKISVDMQDLSDIYCVSKSAITKRKYRLKVDKFNITDNSVNLNDVILAL